MARTHNSIKNHWNCSLKKKLDFFLETGKLPKVVKPKMLNGSKEIVGSASSTYSGLPTGLCRLEDQKNWLELSTVQEYNAEAVNNSTVESSMLTPLSDICTISDLGTESAECSNTGENDQLNDTSAPSLHPAAPSLLGALFCKPPLPEDVCHSKDSALFTSYDSTQQSHCSVIVKQSNGYLTPPSVTSNNGVFCVKSILINAARSYPHTPSIFMRTKRNAEASLASDSTSQKSRAKFLDSSDNVETTNTSVSKFSTSPCSRGAILFNGKNFNVSPPYRLRSKRTAIIKSVEKQLDFAFEETNCDGNAANANPLKMAVDSSSIFKSRNVLPII